MFCGQVEVGYTSSLLAGDGRITVVRNNGPDTPWHLRLLVRASGRVPPEFRAFTGGAWPAARKDQDAMALSPNTLSEAHSDAAGETNGFGTNVGDGRAPAR